MGWKDDINMKLKDIKCEYVTLEKLLEDIGDKKEISLRIEGVIPAQIPDKLSQCVKRLRLADVSMYVTDKHSISTL